LHQKTERSIQIVPYGTGGSVSVDYHVILAVYLFVSFVHRRNTNQTRDKIERIYLTLQEWSTCLATSSKEKTKIDCSPVSDLSVAEIDEFLNRSRRLFSASDYHEQISLMHIAPMNWGWKRLGDFFDCTIHQARSAVLRRSENPDLLKPLDGRGNKPFNRQIADIIQNFYLDDEISRQSSNTKDTRKSKEFGAVVIRYMAMSIGETFELFKIKYPHLKVSRSKFYSLRPKWVREDCPHQVCMCIQHANIELLLTVRTR
jgi:hypothetical protein